MVLALKKWNPAGGMRSVYAEAHILVLEKMASLWIQCPVDSIWPGWGCCVPLPSSPTPQALFSPRCKHGSRDLAGEPAVGPGPSPVRMYLQELGPRCAGALLAGSSERHYFHWGCYPTPSLGGLTRCAGKGLLTAIAALQVFVQGCPGGLGPRRVGLPGRKSRISCSV